MLTERECWDKINTIVRLVALNDYAISPSMAEIEMLEVYVKAILIRRRVEALEE